MNLQLAREIYGQPWLIDSDSIHGLTALLNHYRKGGKVPDSEKANSFGLYDIKSETFIASDAREAKYNFDKQIVSVINLNGAITKNGGESSYGTVDLANELVKFESLKNVIGHIIKIDSGGGSATAVKYLREALLNAKKPSVAYIEDLGASAAYYIATGADHIMANTKEARVGSIGAMIEFSGTPKTAEDKTTGERTVRIYADQSSNKNIEFEEAINNLNFAPIKENILNPLTARFIADVKKRMPNVTEEQLKGGIFEAGKVVGTLIHEIGSFEKAVNKVKQLSKSSGSNISNLNNKMMTKTELKDQHPELYGNLIAQGVEQERKRVRTILKFWQYDEKACIEMIEKGNEPDSEFFADMQLKAISKAQLKEIEKESAPVVVTDPKAESPEVEKPQDKKKSDYVTRMRAAAGIKEQEVK